MSSEILSIGASAMACKSNITVSKNSPVELALNMLVMIAGKPADLLVRADACS